MSMMNRNRRSNTTSRIAPSFRLNDVPERTLLPMVPVGMDSMGNTTYAPRTTTTTTTTGTTGLASHRNTGSATNSATNVGQKKKSPDDDDKKGGDHDGKSHHRHRHSSSSSSESQQQHHHHNQQQAQDDSCCTSTTAACVIRNALYLGGEGDANSATLIRKLRIRRILNVADEIRVKGCWLPSEGKKEEEGDEAAEKLPPAAASVVSPVSVVSVVSSLPSNCSSTTAKVAAVPWSVEVKHIKIRDHSDENISAHFDEAIRFIREGILKNEPVLVHCRFGVSRSATIVIAYLMKYGAVSLYPSPSSNVSSTSISTAGAAAAAAAAATEANNNNNSSNNSSLPLSPLSRPHLLPPPTPRPMSFQDSFDYVKARRPQVSPNLGFCLALHRLDSEMNRSPLVTASP